MNAIIATYYNLNKTYVWQAIVFLCIILITLYWLITHIIAKRNIDSCEDPVALFFDKRMKQRCMVKQWNKDMGWFSEHMEDKFKLLHNTQEYLNSQVDAVLGKYTADNTADFKNAMQELQQKEAEMIALRTKAVETQQLAVQNKTQLQQLWNEWQQRLVEIKEQIRLSLVAKRDAANGYVDQLNQMQRNKKAAKRRAKLVKKYNNTKKYLEKMQTNKEYSDLNLTVNALSNDARYGRK